MSAWMCSQKHLTALVVQALRHCPEIVPSELRREIDSDGHVATRRDYCRAVSRIVQWLASENLRSLEARYPSHYTPAVCSSMLEALEPLTSADEQAALKWSPLVIIKLCHCYAHQSCEHDGWIDSGQKRFVDALELRMVPKLPGYADAPWGLD